MSLILRSACRFSSFQMRRTFRKLSSSSPKGARKRVLGIETSCDDTAAAILDMDGNILSDVCISQLKEHLHNGGVIPTIAKNLHAHSIDRTIVQALDQANMEMKDVDYIAVTNRPGLPLSLEIGVEFAKRLAIKYGKPVIPIHHMEAHALIGMLSDPGLDFPFLVLLLSGGHAQIAFVKDVDHYFLLGTTIDNAPGEILDKVARRMKLRNLGYPFNEISGGEAIEIMARGGDATKFFNDNDSFAPLSNQRNCDFSFSGFRNFVRLIDSLEAKHQTEPDTPVEEVADVAASLQYKIASHIFKRLSRAVEFVERTRMCELACDEITPQNLMTMYGDQTIEETPDNRLHLKIVLSGGVGSSDYFSSCLSRFCSTYSGYFDNTVLSSVIPRPAKLCSDNGIMIAWNAVLKLRAWESKSERERYDERGRQRLLQLQYQRQRQQQYHASHDVTGSRSTAPTSSCHPDTAFTCDATYDAEDDAATAAAEIEPEKGIMPHGVSVRRWNESEHGTGNQKEGREAETAPDAFSNRNQASFMLQSRQEIESLVPVPKISLGCSLREVVAAARIRPAVINRSIFPHFKETPDPSCNQNSAQEAGQ